MQDQFNFASDLFPEWNCDSVELTLLCGEQRKKQKARNYSWIITPESRIAATKSHLHQLREICINPPSFPIAVCLRDGLGKTHELHRTPIVHRWPMRVNFDGLIASYDHDSIHNRLELCRVVAREMGKGGDTAKTIFNDSKVHVWGWRFGDEFLREWLLLKNEPLTRLAWFLCESKQELSDECAA